MSYSEKILVIDDEVDMLENCKRLFLRLGYDNCEVCASPLEALAMIQRERPDLVLTDLRMPEMDGLELLENIKRIDRNIVVIVCTAYASVATAVDAVKKGAYDYISKPFDFDGFSIVVNRALSQKKLSRENMNLRLQLQESYKFDNIVGASLPLLSVLETVKKICKTDANVLIQGESGTGKELIARSIHINSNRANKPFIPIDCASLPETLLETELFGHEKGTFTGADASRAGLFEIANSGTFLLDEVADMTLGTQVKLLRVLQERQVRRVGARKFIDLDIRIISSTNRDVEKDVLNGVFRSDLFYRLNVINIKLPPLRERRGDVEMVANHYLDHFTKFTDKNITSFTQEAMDILDAYHWPGNIRELQNIVERAVSLADLDRIGVENFPDYLRNAKSSSSAPTSAVMQHVIRPDFVMPYKQAKQVWSELSEKEYVSTLLKKNDWNISKASKEARIDRKTLYKLIHRHGLSETM